MGSTSHITREKKKSKVAIFKEQVQQIPKLEDNVSPSA
jgi:hypothetical protein